MTRLNAIEKLVEKYFTLYSPLQEKLINGHLCYGNKELTIYDNLFNIRIITPLNWFDCDNINGLCKVK